MADVGIVMPVYKQNSKIFKKAIESIINQKYFNFQFVIVIDGITPNVERIAQHYARKDPRIIVISRQNNSGTAAALNIGFDYLMKQRKIEFLTWVSSDNIYYPNFVEVLRKQLKKSPPEVGLAYGSFRFVNDQGKKIDKNYNLLKWQNQPKENLVNYYFLGYAFMYKKRIAQKIEGYKYTPVEDLDFFLRLTEHCDITFVPIELMDFRLNSPHSNSIEINNSEEKRRMRRYLMFLVMNEALQRRNISPELTIIFPVGDSSEKSIQALENILDQFLSNFKLIIYDVSANKEFLPVINEIPDIRTQYFSAPSGNLDEISLKSLELADTRFVMFFRSENCFQHPEQLKEMLNAACTNPFNSQGSAGLVYPKFGKIYPKEYLSSLLNDNNN
ncbi:glycosyltransferase family 2 protein [Halalkalibacter hemicellulosilyticus]|uniref:Glycosyltransferase n=1 Tax=Halalkalibacter hemicellulosilyticusJCM 9152 TaxID=1236971 RepID=W4QFZ2_9BACI|nr:glycosyltransferase family A protein [Halalkalibacter hemicellulosilyticus]GAE30986.1 glycosyltransferase [Halalkalibacter hemicellulosilyticusJCM 9152]